MCDHYKRLTALTVITLSGCTLVVVFHIGIQNEKHIGRWQKQNWPKKMWGKEKQ